MINDREDKLSCSKNFFHVNGALTKMSSMNCRKQRAMSGIHGKGEKTTVQTCSIYTHYGIAPILYALSAHFYYFQTSLLVKAQI